MKDWRPKRCEIGGLIFKIKYIQPGTHPLLKENECGAVDKLNQRILIDKTLNRQFTLLVLIHEILHAIGDAMQSNRNPFVNEGFTSVVSEMLLQALQTSKLLNVKISKSHPNHGKQINKNQN